MRNGNRYKFFIEHLRVQLSLILLMVMLCVKIKYFQVFKEREKLFVHISQIKIVILELMYLFTN